LLPAFSETLFEERSTQSGLSLIRPSRQRTEYVQVKNGVVELPVSGNTFMCWVANFASHPVYLRKGQVVGVAESQESASICTVPVEQDKDQRDPSWEDTVRTQSNHLNVDEQDRLVYTLREHSSLWDGHLGNITAVEHHIPIEGRPIASQPYRVGPTARELIDKELTRMKDLGVVEPSGGPWASPVVLIPKPDGSVRFCVDYRRLNAVTTKDSYALPRIDDSIDSLRGAQYFSTLDANSGYWQIAGAAEDQEKTAFTTHRGLYCFKRLPFGLASAPATFQRAVDVILSSVRFQCAPTYLDDIILYSTTFEQHLSDLRTVLSLLNDAGVTLKLSKCKFSSPEFPYLGYRVGRDGLRVDNSKIATLQAAMPQTSKTGVHRFLGMCGVYRRFIPRYAKVAAALTNYLKDEMPDSFVLNTDALQAQSDLKDAITSAPILALPRATGMYVLKADASATQLGVQLLQEQPDKTFRPIGFWSRQCNQAECN
jgi:Reverse transcriptase (RNA-dependent DNA polymerase)/RNase H-like domain found in reverse transcriptase